MSARRIDAVCGPLSGGAFLAQLIAADLGVEFAFAERSAVRGTLADVKACAALPLVLGALISFGSRAREIAADERIPLESLVQLPNPIWAPTECPMCALGAPLQTP